MQLVNFKKLMRNPKQLKNTNLANEFGRPKENMQKLLINTNCLELERLKGKSPLTHKTN